MMRFILNILICVIIMMVSFSAQARQESIAVVVNDDAITMSNLQDRLKLILTSSGLPDTVEIKERLLPQVTGALIEEQIKLQEARRLGIEIEQAEIKDGFAKVAAQNNFSTEQFSTMFEKGGLNIQSLYDQIEAQIAWTKIVQQEIRPKVNITDGDIENVRERLRNNIGMIEYNIAEIFLPVDDPQNEANTRQLAQRIAAQINSGQAPFSKLAQQFSKAAGSPQGGDVGWVQQNQMPEELAKALQGVQKGKISAPVRSLNGYHIMLLRDQRHINEETMPTEDQITSKIGFERLERLQRRYYLDLRASAFIETRLGN